MTALTANITDSQTLIPVDAGLVNGTFQLPLYYTVGSEAIRVTGRAHRTSWLVERGIAGTTAASHSSGATLTRYYPEAAAGEGEAGESVLSVASVTLTDAQIKALPTTPVVIVPATEVLGYSGIPTEVFIPVLTIVSTNAWLVPYSNLDAGDSQRFGLYIGSDAGAGPISVSVYNTDLNETGGQLYMLSPQAIGLASGAKIEGPFIALGGGIQDNALSFAANNTGGNFTDGDPANTLKVTVLYYTATL